MSILQQLEMASMVADEKYLSREFNISYIKYREKSGILESMINALKDNNLYSDFKDMMSEKV